MGIKFRSFGRTESIFNYGAISPSPVTIIQIKVFKIILKFLIVKNPKVVATYFYFIIYIVW